MCKRIAGVILAGGKNARMGGKSKGLLTYEGQRFLDIAAKALRETDALYLSVNAENAYANEALPRIIDRHDAIGPMGGVYSALTEIQEDAALFLPCDAPLVTVDALAPLIHSYRANGKAAFFADAKGRPNPLIGIYPKDCLPLIEKMIADGTYRMRALINALPHATLTPANEQALRNINSPEEYEKLLSGT